GVPQIEVTFEIDANGLVHVSAKDLGTGKQQSIRITASSGLSEDEISRMIGEAKDHEQDDVRKRELAELRNNADGLVYTTELSLKEYRKVIPEGEVNEIQRDLEECKRVLQSNDTT